MENLEFAVDEFTFGGIQDKPSSSNKGCGSLDGQTIQKQINYYGIEDTEEIESIDTFSSDFDFCRDDSMEE
ncbi:hypothetical protein SLA2020_528990 [Shorea laevis]